MNIRFTFLERIIIVKDDCDNDSQSWMNYCVICFIKTTYSDYI